MDSYKFLDTARRLRVLVPLVWPVRIRRLEIEDLGDCAFIQESKDGPRFVIRINRSLEETTQVLVLIHEWAHALSWGSDSHRIGNHGPEWGIAMSRVWQSLLED